MKLREQAPNFIILFFNKKKIKATMDSCTIFWFHINFGFVEAADTNVLKVPLLPHVCLRLR